MKSNINFKTALIALCFAISSCKTYNAVGPAHLIKTNPISQDNSTITIPIAISNEKIREIVKSSAPVPLKEDNVTVKIPVFNPVTVPVLTVQKIIVHKMCDVMERQRVSWKCLFCPACCFAMVMVQKACDVEETVEKWIDQEIINKINVDAPVYYKFVVNDFHIDGNNDEIHFHLLLDFKVKADVDLKLIKGGVASCGMNEDMPQVELVLSSKVNFADGGTINLTDKRWEINWVKACNLTALDIKAEDLINLPFVKGMIEKKVDDLVQNKIPNDINLKDKLEPKWGNISKPMVIANAGYFDLNIKQINTEKLFVTNTNIETELGATCKPVFKLTDDAPVIIAQPFPGITTNKLPDGFNLNILGAISFDNINKYAKPIFDKYKENVEGKLLKFRDIEFFQSGDKLVIEVSLAKPFRGKIYLWGKPQFNIAENTVTLDSLEYTLESKNLIAKVANWLLQTGIIEKRIKEKFKYKYEKNINDALAKVSDFSYPVGNNVTIKGKCDKVKPVDFVVSDNFLNIVVNVGGEASVDIK